MKRPSIQQRMLLRPIPAKVQPKGWGGNAIRDTLVDLQRKVHEKTKMNMSSWRHDNLYKFEEILYVHGGTWKVGSKINRHKLFLAIYFILVSSTHDEWEEGLDNDEAEYAIPQYVEIAF